MSKLISLDSLLQETMPENDREGAGGVKNSCILDWPVNANAKRVKKLHLKILIMKGFDPSISGLRLHVLDQSTTTNS